MRLDWDQAVAIGSLIVCAVLAFGVLFALLRLARGVGRWVFGGSRPPPSPCGGAAGGALRRDRHGGRSRRHKVEPRRGVPPDRGSGAKAPARRRRPGGAARRSRRGPLRIRETHARSDLIAGRYRRTPLRSRLSSRRRAKKREVGAVKLRLFILLHLAATAIGTAAFWWSVLRDHPAEAVADGIGAGAMAGYAEIMFVRLRGRARPRGSTWGRSRSQSRGRRKGAPVSGGPLRRQRRPHTESPEWGPGTRVPVGTLLAEAAPCSRAFAPDAVRGPFRHSERALLSRAEHPRSPEGAGRCTRGPGRPCVRPPSVGETGG